MSACGQLIDAKNKFSQQRRIELAAISSSTPQPATLRFTSSRRRFRRDFNN